MGRQSAGGLVWGPAHGGWGHRSTLRDTGTHMYRYCQSFHKPGGRGKRRRREREEEEEEGEEKQEGEEGVGGRRGSRRDKREQDGEEGAGER